MAERKFAFSRASRIGGYGVFAQVRQGGKRIAAGPLVFFIKPNDTDRSRLGISIGRHIGTAVKRNRIKRLLREAFRLSQNELRSGLDIVVNVRPHETLSLAEYQQLLVSRLGRER